MHNSGVSEKEDVANYRNSQSHSQNMYETNSDYFRENVIEWDVGQVVKWATEEKLHGVVNLLKNQDINGRALLMLTERDLDQEVTLTIGLRKNVMLAIRQLQRTSNLATLEFLGLLDVTPNNHHTTSNSSQNTCNLMDHHQKHPPDHHPAHHHHPNLPPYGGGSGRGSGSGDISPASSTIGGMMGTTITTSNKPEFFKTFVSVRE